MRTYLGDSVYIYTQDARGLWKICTNNGGPDRNEIWLEPEVVTALVDFFTNDEKKYADD